MTSFKRISFVPRTDKDGSMNPVHLLRARLDVWTACGVPWHRSIRLACDADVADVTCLACLDAMKPLTSHVQSV